MLGSAMEDHSAPAFLLTHVINHTNGHEFLNSRSFVLILNRMKGFSFHLQYIHPRCKATLLNYSIIISYSITYRYNIRSYQILMTLFYPEKLA